MPIRELTRFKQWAKSNGEGGLLCHFYIERGKEKQYYGKEDFAYFNLASKSTDWIIKGTTEHGITDNKGNRSTVPCLNCFEVNDSFYDALEAERKVDFPVGLLIRKDAASKRFKVIQVEAFNFRNPRPPPKKCHHYDLKIKRNALAPFHKCDVVRLQIWKWKLLGQPITRIPRKMIAGFLVNGSIPIEKLRESLKKKNMVDAEIFQVL